MKQTISVLVENQAGALNRITGLFAVSYTHLDVYKRQVHTRVIVLP